MPACVLGNYATEYLSLDRLNARQFMDSPIESAAGLNSTDQNDTIGPSFVLTATDATNRPDEAVHVFSDGEAQSQFVAENRLNPGKRRLTDGYLQRAFAAAQ